MALHGTADFLPTQKCTSFLERLSCQERWMVADTFAPFDPCPENAIGTSPAVLPDTAQDG